MSGKGTAGIGILLAAVLVVWAVVNPGPESSRTTTGTSPASTGFRVAGGAALGGQSELAKLFVEAVDSPTGIDDDALRDLLEAYLEENGIDSEANQEAIADLIARYQSIASQAQAFLNQTNPRQALALLNQDPPALDPEILRTLLSSDSPAGALLRQRVGSGRMDRMNQLGGLAGSQTPVISGGAGGDAGSGTVDATALAGIDWTQFERKQQDDPMIEEEFFQKAIGYQEGLAQLGYPNNVAP